MTLFVVCVDLRLHIFLSELLGLSEFILLNAGVCGGNLGEREGVNQSGPTDKIKSNQQATVTRQCQPRKCHMAAEMLLHCYCHTTGWELGDWIHGAKFHKATLSW